MSDRIGVLLAGFGGIGSQDHQNDMYLPAFVANDAFDIVGAVDVPGGDGAGSAARAHGFPYFADLDEGLAHPAVDVVSVAAPLQQRAQVVARAVQAGKHVLADKPLAASLVEMEEIARLAQRQHVVVVPAHHLRLRGVLRSARSAVRAGRIGLPWNVQADFLVAGGDVAPTGELVNLALYAIDAIHALLGLAAVRVHAIGRRYWHDSSGDFVTLMIDHERHVTSTIVCGRMEGIRDVRPGGLAVHRYRVSGSHGVLTTDASKPALVVRSAQRHDLSWTGPDTIDALLDVLRTGVRSGRAELGVADAIYVQRVVEAAQLSLERGRPVDIEHARPNDTKAGE